MWAAGDSPDDPRVESLAELFIENGADVNARDKKGNTALSMAKRAAEGEDDPGSHRIIDLLIKKGAK
jgi:ankyrin repeat protein